MEVTIFEKSKKVLAKVEVSGGGRSLRPSTTAMPISGLKITVSVW